MPTKRTTKPKLEWAMDAAAKGHEQACRKFGDESEAAEICWSVYQAIGGMAAEKHVRRVKPCKS